MNLNQLMDPKAQKRFDNDRVRAAQANLTSPAAKSSLHTSVNRGVNRTPGKPQMEAPPVNLLGGNTPGVPQVTAGMSPGNLGGANETMDIEQTLKNDLDLDMFLSSPELQQSMARSRLRQYFKRNQPSGAQFDIASDALGNLLHNM